MREGVGILEIANYGKHEVTGPGAEAWLDRLLAGRLPPPGRVGLAPMLGERGKLMGDLTVARTGPERFMIVGSGAAERFHLRWFEAHLPERGVAVRPIAAERVGFALAGPRSRELLARLTDEDLSAAAFRFFDIRRIDVATRAGAGREGLVHGRARLRDLRRCGLRARPLRCAARGAAATSASSISAAAR